MLVLGPPLHRGARVISLSSLSDAAGWGHNLCLECSATFDPSLEDCPVCGSEHTIRAEDALAVVALLEEDTDI